ncbi:DUF418 domain-containing protein [Sphingomonas sp.]|uniref:DUF418 domain-containing protein n=1 Tax=Sphingomonas sp. TaxID=28214 RepID=UPI002DD64C8B|nr:DUF418 domain-containing protein [Sphingomonas sp.]
MATTNTAGAGDRFLTLDAIRGVAVMGILLMNIVGFGLIGPAYMNPLAQGGAAGLDLAVYLFNFVMFDGKMRGLFSFLFGASTLLVIDRATAKGESAALVHYSRMVWLLVFGLIHLWFIWWGDILNHYALVGMIAFFFRNTKVKTLVVVGCILVALQTLLMAGLAGSVHALENGLGDMPAAERAKQLAEFSKGFGIPPAAWIAEQMANHHAGYWTMVTAEFEHTRYSVFFNAMYFTMETLGYFLLGMAAFRSGMLTGAWSRARYVKWLAIGFGIGIPVYGAIAWYMLSADFSMSAVVVGVMALSTPVRPLMILGWAALIVLLIRPGGMLTARIAAAGRMAFTNYLMTSILMTTLFSGYGFGLYGELSRAELYLAVFGMWALMLLWSKPWLERFRFGPFEWLWRTLARGSVQSIRGGALAPA